jgi:hypothetical protein
MPLKKVLVALAVVLFATAAYQIAQYAIETLLSDAATRLAYQIRDEAASLKRSGQSNRTFEHAPHDVVVSHQAGEATRVTLELKEGKVLLTASSEASAPLLPRRPSRVLRRVGPL